MEAEVAVATRDILGESACWSRQGGELLWIDGAAPSIQGWHPRTRAHRILATTTGYLGMIAPTEDADTLVVADRHGVSLLSLDSGERSVLAVPEHGREGIQYNDGKIDPLGRLWVGTCDSSEREPRGCLWLLAPGQPPRLADSGFAVVNGPAFSSTGDVLYLSDSLGRRILAYSVSGETLKDRRVFATLTAEEGVPDGLTVDAEGCVWCAHWDGGQVCRYSPRGERLLRIALPVPRVTSVAFGDEDLGTLYITTARYGLNESDLERAPLAGQLFRVRPGAVGVPAIPLPLPFR